MERIYGHGAHPCPTCRKSLRRYDFKEQTFENLEVEKEVDIRKRILKQLNKEQTAFYTSREDSEEVVLRRFNDYLEELEDIIFNLANGIDVAATNEKVEQYRNEIYASRGQVSSILPSTKKSSAIVDGLVFVDPILDALYLTYEKDHIDAMAIVARQKAAYEEKSNEVFRFGQDLRVKAGGYKSEWTWQRAIEDAGAIGGLFQLVDPL